MSAARRNVLLDPQAALQRIQSDLTHARGDVLGKATGAGTSPRSALADAHHGLPRRVGSASDEDAVFGDSVSPVQDLHLHEQQQPLDRLDAESRLGIARPSTVPAAGTTVWDDALGLESVEQSTSGGSTSNDSDSDADDTRGAGSAEREWASRASGATVASSKAATPGAVEKAAAAGQSRAAQIAKIEGGIISTFQTRDDRLWRRQLAQAQRKVNEARLRVMQRRDVVHAAKNDLTVALRKQRDLQAELERLAEEHERGQREQRAQDPAVARPDNQSRVLNSFNECQGRFRLQKQQVAKLQAAVVQAGEVLALAEDDERRIIADTAEQRAELQELLETQRGAARYREHKERRIARAQQASMNATQRQVDAEERAQRAKVDQQRVNAEQAQRKTLRRLQEGKRVIERNKRDVQRFEAEDRSRQIQSLLSLKKSTARAHDELRAKVARRKQHEMLERRREQQEKQDILAAGGNPYEVWREREEARIAMQMESKQKRVAAERKVALTAQLLAEEEQYARQQEAKAETKAYERRFRESLGTKVQQQRTLQYLKSRTGRELVDPTGRQHTVHPSKVSRVHDRLRFGLGKAKERDVKHVARQYQDDDDFQQQLSRSLARDVPLRVTTSIGATPASVAAAAAAAAGGTQQHSNKDKDNEDMLVGDSDGSSDEDEPDAERLAVAEVPGAWVSDGEPPQPEEHRITVGARSKLEQRMAEKRRAQHRANLTQAQVTLGRRFTGAAFITHPARIEFADFEPGQVYTKKVLLTNVSYTFNSFKLLPLPDHMRNFLEVRYNKPGRMSAGMTCPLYIQFSPKVARDLVGELPILAQTGALSVPIECRIKKTVIDTSPRLIDLGSLPLGETVSRTITIRNAGARATTVRVERVALPGTAQLPDASNNDRDGVVPSVRSRSAPMRRDPAATATSVSTADEESDGSPTSSVTWQPGIGETIQVSGYSSISVTATFAPVVTGSVSASVRLCFLDPELNGDPLLITATAEGIDVPLYVEGSEINFDVCHFDVLYRDTLTLCNRGKTALKAMISVPAALRSCVSFVPRVAYVQPGVPFPINIKFTPSQALLRHTDDEHQLSLPMQIHAPDQTLPVDWLFKAKLCSSDLVFEPASLSFGSCPMNEAVSLPISVTNKSMITQRFGFPALSRDFEINPSAGFGEILPGETLELTVVFRPSAAVRVRTSIKCCTLANRTFAIACTGEGVVPPIVLSANMLKLRAVVYGDQVEETIWVRSRLNTAQTIEFGVPSDAPLTFQPAVATLAPGETQYVRVRFQSLLSDLPGDSDSDDSDDDGGDGDGDGDGDGIGGDAGNAPEPTGQQVIPDIEVTSNAAAHAVDSDGEGEDSEDGDEYDEEEEDEILGSRHRQWTVPLFVQGQAHCQHLAVRVCELPPLFVVASEIGAEGQAVDFGKIVAGKSVIKVVSLQNVSEETIQINADPLDPYGPMQILNALRPLPPDGISDVIISFAPTEQAEYAETLRLHTPGQALELRCLGQGVRPRLRVQPDGAEPLDLGDVAAGSRATSQVTLVNPSAFPVSFQALTMSTGEENASGIAVFDAVPVEGTVGPGASVAIALSFRPDHASIRYAGTLCIVTGAQTDDSHRIPVLGRSWSSAMYLLGGEADDNVPEYDSSIWQEDRVGAEASEDARHRLVMTWPKNASASVQIGCLAPALAAGADAPGAPSADLADRKTSGAGKAQGRTSNGEFTVDALPAAAVKAGFSISPMKGTVEAGKRVLLQCTFDPPRVSSDSNNSSSMAVVGLGQWASSLATVRMKSGTDTSKAVLEMRGLIAGDLVEQAAPVASVEGTTDSRKAVRRRKKKQGKA